MVKFDFSPERDVPSLAGKVILITGGEALSLALALALAYDTTDIFLASGTAGIGAETILQLAPHNPTHIYFTGRNAKAAAAVEEKVKEVAPDAKLTFLSCDLASLSHVKAATDEFLEINKEGRLDILICNAGIMALPPALTKDGYEIQFGTNHLGHALIIKKLLPSLLKTDGARLINLTSLGFILHPKGGIIFKDLKTTQDTGFMGSWTRYAQSKLANIVSSFLARVIKLSYNIDANTFILKVYTRELARRYPAITTVAIHPGITTGGYLTAAQGAYNEVWAATADAAKVKSGEMYEPVGVLTKQLNNDAKSDELAEKLWTWTEEQLEAF
ncbi:putative oxidoreductase [Lachnellula hyalina]|uniref:Putative oxidoreductase n=1 Tax=Lachnellula hyalina TaxID=1316788 RepID=A0A8H8QUU8_9HELO|nr:putative oxidoreductase [Lachnellula hyalina]TVY23159.1 putative oxidoreductase [Lachnellula hyalina]